MRLLVLGLLGLVGCAAQVAPGVQSDDAGVDASAGSRAQAALVATIGPRSVATPGFETCPVPSSSPLLSVGAFGSATQEDTHVVVDGDTVDGARVGVTCSVVPSGDDFAVDVTAQGAEGLVRVHGVFTANGDQRDVEATFQSAELGEYAAKACTVTYYDVGDDRGSPSYGVAAGRVRGFLTCELAKNESSLHACRATAQFRFENCTR